MKPFFSFFIFLILTASCGTKEIVSTVPTTKDTASEASPEAATIKVNPKNEKDIVVLDEAYLDDKGYGPITSITLEAIDPTLAAQGKQIFENNCSACHRMDKKWIGPSMRGITKRRSPEWIMNIIFNPQEMMEKNPAAKKLLEEYKAPMPNQQLNIDQARSLLEYFRLMDN